MSQSFKYQHRIQEENPKGKHRRNAASNVSTVQNGIYNGTMCHVAK